MAPYFVRYFIYFPMLTVFHEMSDSLLPKYRMVVELCSFEFISRLRTFLVALFPALSQPAPVPSISSLNSSSLSHDLSPFYVETVEECENRRNQTHRPLMGLPRATQSRWRRQNYYFVSSLKVARLKRVQELRRE